MVAVSLPSTFTDDFQMYVAPLFSLDPNPRFQLHISKVSHKGIFTTVTQLVIFPFILSPLLSSSLINSNITQSSNLKTFASSSIFHFALPQSSSPGSVSQRTVDSGFKIITCPFPPHFCLGYDSGLFYLDHYLAPCKQKHVTHLITHKTYL